MRAKVAACAFSRGYLNGIVRSVLQGLEQQGFFQDPVQLEVRGREGRQQVTGKGCCWGVCCICSPYSLPVLYSQL